MKVGIARWQRVVRQRGLSGSLVAGFLVAGFLVAGFLVAGCSGDDADQPSGAAAGFATGVEVPIETEPAAFAGRSMWNVTASDPQLIRRVTSRDRAVSAEIRMALAEADNGGASTWGLVWQLVGGATGETYAVLPADLFDPPVCPEPKTIFVNGYVPIGYASEGSVCFLVPADDAEHPDTAVELTGLASAQFRTDGVVPEPAPSGQAELPDGYPFASDVEIAPGQLQSEPWSIRVDYGPGPDNTSTNADLDELAAATTRVSVSAQMSGVVNADTLARPEIFVVGGATEQVFRQACDLLAPTVYWEAPTPLERCIVIPTQDLTHPDTRVGVIYNGETLIFGGTATDDA